MDKQAMLHRWMNGELSKEQEIALREDPDMRIMMDLATASSRLEAPEFPKDALFEDIKVLNQPPKVRKLNPLKYVVRIAAVFAIVAVSYVYWQGLDTTVGKHQCSHRI